MNSRPSFATYRRTVATLFILTMALPVSAAAQTFCIGGRNPGAACATDADCGGACTPNANFVCLNDGQCPGSNTCTNPSPGACVDVNLPVEFSSFAAIGTQPGAVLLLWETASETNNAGFEIQHKTRNTFAPLAYVEGSGTTFSPKSYEYEVTGLEANVHTFRLRQVDLDGAVSFSDEVEVEVEVPGRMAVYDVYPNPFSRRSTVRFAVASEQTVEVSLHDPKGSLVTTLFSGRVEAGTTTSVDMDADDLADGLYLVRISADGMSESRQVVVAR